ncbi:MAG: threonylcarbamoyl-AMP synthase [Turicibacter sp.]|nr:threonylcarbamoyl-AMP synthase [Turicibacter sp.]MBQ8992595.1 threonylcarbamoyl-AMP synthase [Turicibacter sp.]
MIYRREQLSEVLQAITQEDVIVFPTDTVYGIGASIFSPKALDKIFEIKNRPTDKSLIVLCADELQLEEIVGPLSVDVKKIIDAFLPGGLTLILNCYMSLPEEITRGKQTIGVRIPDHPLALELLKKFGPLATTSANISGEPSPTKIDRLNPVIQRVNYVFDDGETKQQIPSTILDCTKDEFVILREGAITLEEIQKVLHKK